MAAALDPQSFSHSLRVRDPDELNDDQLSQYLRDAGISMDDLEEAVEAHAHAASICTAEVDRLDAIAAFPVAAARRSSASSTSSAKGSAQESIVEPAVLTMGPPALSILIPHMELPLPTASTSTSPLSGLMLGIGIGWFILHAGQSNPPLLHRKRVISSTDIALLHAAGVLMPPKVAVHTVSSIVDVVPGPTADCDNKGRSSSATSQKRRNTHQTRKACNNRQQHLHLCRSFFLDTEQQEHDNNIKDSSTLNPSTKPTTDAPQAAQS